MSAPHAALLMVDAAAALPPVDPNFANVSVLLHLDSVMSTVASLSRVQNFGYDTTQWDFGSNATMNISGTNPLYSNSLQWPTPASAGNRLLPAAGSSNFVLGTGDFTWEFAYFTPNPASTYVLLDYTGAKPELYTSGSKYQWFNGTSTTIANAGTVLTNTWQRIAVSRNSGTLRMFVDGTQVGSVADAVNYTANDPMFGLSRSSTFPIVGRMDEIRLTLGVGRYTANYTVATAAFPNF